MTSQLENIPVQKTEDDSRNIPKVDQGDAMESFIKREYDVDVKTPEEQQGDATESFLESEYGENDKKENVEQKQKIEREKAENFKKTFSKIEALNNDEKIEELKKINSDLKNTLEKMLDPLVSREDFQEIVGDFNDVNMKEKEGAYNSVELDDGRITVKYYENGSFSISGRYNEERGIIDLEDLEDKELVRLSNEMKKARENYNKNKEKTDGAWQRIRNVFPKLILGENSTSAQESRIYLKRYEEARNNLLKYQTEKLKKRNLPKEKRVKEVADLSKHYNEDEQYDSLDKKTGEKFRFSDEEKNENKIRKKEKKESSAEKNRKKALGEMFKKYKINEKDGYYDQSSNFIDKLMREVAMGHYKNWKNSKDKKIVDFIDEEGKSRDEVSKNIQKMEKYFENILGEKGKFEKNETVKQWLVRIIKESLEVNK